MQVGTSRAVKAWDWPTRAFHWLLVLGIVSAMASHSFGHAMGDHTLIWHRWNGYFVLVLLVFRFIWGFVGSSTARFAHFLRGPFFILGYVGDALRGKKRRFLGHNPLGSVVIFILLGGVFLQATLGLFTLEHNEIVAGPLKRLLSDEQTELVSKLHVRGFNILLAVIGLHILANSLYGLFAGEPLITAMVTGKKPAAAYEDGAEAEISAHVTRRAAITFLAAIIIVFGGITALGGTIL